MSIKFLELSSETLSFKGNNIETIESEELNSAPMSYSISI